MPAQRRARCRLLAAVALAALVAAPGLARADARSEAAAAYQRGDFRTARSLWLPLAKAGSADAAYRLGLLSDLGQGTPEDPPAAFRWYRQAAQAGYPAAEFNVAVMADSDRGVPHDTRLAAEWYARAATHGNHRAQYNLGLLYNAGDGVPRNRAVAQAWFHLAEIGGIPAAAEHLDPPARHPEASGAPSPTLRPVVPVAPRDRATLDRNEVEIVWAAPSQPVPVRFFLQVEGRDGSQSHELYAGYTDATAALVRVAPGHAAYFWRVFTVSPSTADYRIGPWRSFTLRKRAGLS